MIATTLAVGGGVYWWQKSGFEKERQGLEERIKKLENQLAQLENDPYKDWKTYRSEECGFEIKYPQKAGKPQESPTPGDVCHFIGIIPGGVYVALHEATEDSLADWIKKNESCDPRDTNNYMYLDMNRIYLENYNLAGLSALRIKNLGGCPPGGSSSVDNVYTKYNSKIYEIKHISLGGNEWWWPKTEKEKEEILDLMLATFKLLP